MRCHKSFCAELASEETSVEDGASEGVAVEVAVVTCAGAGGGSVEAGVETVSPAEE